MAGRDDVTLARPTDVLPQGAATVARVRPLARCVLLILQDRRLACYSAGARRRRADEDRVRLPTTVQGMELAVDDPGGHGSTVVCLPMFSTTRATTAAAFAPAFAGTGLREIYIDPPGHGNSPGAGEADSRTVLAVICSWLEQHLEAPTLLAGASYGGYLAAAIARQRPALVRGLLLVCPGVRVGPDTRDLPRGEPPSTEPDWLTTAPPDLRGHLDLALGRRTATVVETVLAALTAGGPGDDDYLDRLRSSPGYALADEDADVAFGGPVTVMTGRQDRIVGYADQFRGMRNYPRGTYTVVDEAGHFLPFEQPELFRALSQDWLHRCATSLST